MVSMSKWRVFLQWGHEAFRVLDPRKPMRALSDELAQEWRIKQNPVAYIKAIQRVRHRQQEVRQYAVVVLADRKTADIARLLTGKSASVEPERALERSLRDLLASRNSLVVALHNLEVLHNDAAQKAEASECAQRSREYTRKLLGDAQRTVTETKIALLACRDVQKFTGELPFRDSVDWDSEDNANAPPSGFKRRPPTALELDRLFPRGLSKQPKAPSQPSAILPKVILGTSEPPVPSVHRNAGGHGPSRPAQKDPNATPTAQEDDQNIGNVGDVGKSIGEHDSHSNSHKRTAVGSERQASSKKRKASEDDDIEHNTTGVQDQSAFAKMGGQGNRSQERLQQKRRSRLSSVPPLITDSDVPSVGQSFNKRLRDKQHGAGDNPPIVCAAPSVDEQQAQQEADVPEYDPTTPLVATPTFERPKNLRKAAKDLGFGSPKGLEGNWNFLDTIGEGRYGHAGLFVQYGPDARIVNRTVIKDTWLKSTEWPRKQFWHDMAGRLPKEVHMHRSMSALPRAWPVAGFLGWDLFEELGMYRIYMPFYPHGDLGKVIVQYAKLEDALDGQGNKISALIPARVIWSFFEALAASACLTKDGAFPGDTAPPEWVGELIHRDVKPINVFLDQVDRDSWRTIPVAKLGDYGLAMLKDTPDMSNSKRMVGTGTVGYQAPEQMKQADENAYRFRLSSKVDVYAIGKTMLSLMDLQLGDGVEAYGYETVPIPARVRDSYPPELVNLLEQCLEDSPMVRIAADDLLRAITEAVTVSRDGFGSTPLKYQSWNERQPLRVQPDMYEAFAK
ncbi:hypothetical protein LTR85_005616 [Meristemomyces frigidus]|nr:hypothetical protein LTR85_005616 [Meristemomyces frigidus]